jgi:hypothetical protein
MNKSEYHEHSSMMCFKRSHEENSGDQEELLRLGHIHYSIYEEMA